MLLGFADEQRRRQISRDIIEIKILFYSVISFDKEFQFPVTVLSIFIPL